MNLNGEVIDNKEYHCVECEPFYYVSSKVCEAHDPNIIKSISCSEYSTTS